MKTYIKPVLTDVNLGEVEINGENHEVVGVVPFIVAVLSAATAVASAAASVANAKQTYKDGYMDSHSIQFLDKVE